MVRSGREAGERHHEMRQTLMDLVGRMPPEEREAIREKLRGTKVPTFLAREQPAPRGEAPAEPQTEGKPARPV